jgi:hypothetical protein
MVVWKAIYNDYVIAFPYSPFQEDTLKDWLQDALKDLKVDTFNEEGTEKVVLQSNDFKLAMNNYATRNVLKGENIY